MNDLMHKIPTEPGSDVLGTEFDNLGVNIAINEYDGGKLIIVALFNGELDEDTSFFAIGSAEQTQAIIEALQVAMKDAFQHD